jgi:PPOX class probable F420-dependent enzyme
VSDTKAGASTARGGTVATMTNSAERVQNFIRSNHRGVLATVRRDGRPQLSPVLVGTDDDGSLVISTSERTVKVANIRRTAWVSVCVFNDQFFGEWVQAEGPATVESMPGALEGLVRYYRLLAGEHPDWDDYRAAMRRDRRALIRIRIARVAPTLPN